MGKARDRRNNRKDRAWLRAFVPWIVAVLFVGMAMLAGHIIPMFEDALADNVKCEDDKDCYWAYHKDHEKKDQCRSSDNNQWIFYDPLRPCGDEPPKKPQYTNTPKKQQATQTQVPKEPTATDEPIQPSATSEEEKQPTATQMPETKTSPTATGYIDPTKEEDEKNPTATLRPTDGGNERTYKSPTPSATAIFTVTAEQPDEDCEWCLMARWFLSLFERLVVAEEQETNYMATQVSK